MQMLPDVKKISVRAATKVGHVCFFYKYIALFWLFSAYLFKQSVSEGSLFFLFQAKKTFLLGSFDLHY
jgi:hypothetical protein